MGNKRTISYRVETSANRPFVILSEAKDLIFPRIYEILRSLRFLRMTREETFAEVSSCVGSAIWVAAGESTRLHGRDACATCLIATRYQPQRRNENPPLALLSDLQKATGFQPEKEIGGN